jgi:hypothetical protein
LFRGPGGGRLDGATKVSDVGGASNFGEIGQLPQSSGER